MIRKEVIIKNKTGLHARPAARFVSETKKYASEINMVCDGKEVNAKSIMGVMTVGAVKGKKIILKAEGEDEEKAIQELTHYLEEELPLIDKDEE